MRDFLVRCGEICDFPDPKRAKVRKLGARLTPQTYCEGFFLVRCGEICGFPAPKRTKVRELGERVLYHKLTVRDFFSKMR